MNHADRLPDPGRTLTTDHELEETIGRLLEHAMNPRQVWLLFIDDAHRLTPAILPLAGYPRHPADRVVTADLGECGFARVLAHRLRSVLAAEELSEAALVWERLGADSFTPDDLAWACALADECRVVGVPLRAQFVLHDGGLRPIAADDYAGTEWRDR